MIVDKITADKKLRRMALQVAERNNEKDSLVLVGIKENGIFIAHKIAAYLKDVFKGKVQVVSLAIDKNHPADIVLSQTVALRGKTIILVDDVANSGRTMLYALRPLLAEYPEGVQTLVLVERTHKQFPVAIDYVGLSVSSTRDENIVVTVEDGEVTSAYLDQPLTRHKAKNI
jgi:pyrimidine operon attenuation protein / uracil phosphoribosyltransferase